MYAIYILIPSISVSVLKESVFKMLEKSRDICANTNISINEMQNNALDILARISE